MTMKSFCLKETPYLIFRCSRTVSVVNLKTLRFKKIDISMKASMRQYLTDIKFNCDGTFEVWTL